MIATSWNQSKRSRSCVAPRSRVTSANVIIDRMTGKSGGFGFVEMPDNDEATKAIQALNDSPIKGRPGKVNEARPREDRPPRRDGGFGGGGGGGFGGGGRGPRY